jgi:hypothetical protein
MTISSAKSNPVSCPIICLVQVFMNLSNGNGERVSQQRNVFSLDEAAHHTVDQDGDDIAKVSDCPRPWEDVLKRERAPHEVEGI